MAELTTNVDRIKEYYNNGAQHEWDRHERHRFEFPVTMHFLNRYIGDSCKILDIGGGPGRYSIELAKSGHDVTLFDLAEENIALAKEKARLANISFHNAISGDARELSRYIQDSFDVVLIFGPLYHLNREEDRKKVIDEALTVLKPGGIIACAYISQYAPLFDTARRFGHTIEEAQESLLKYLKNGTHINSDSSAGFTDAYFCDPMEIEPLMESCGLEKLCLFGAESCIAQSEVTLIELGEELLQKWISFACETAETPGALYGSDHLVYMGRKV